MMMVTQVTKYDRNVILIIGYLHMSQITGHIIT